MGRTGRSGRALVIRCAITNRRMGDATKNLHGNSLWKSADALLQFSMERMGGSDAVTASTGLGQSGDFTQRFLDVRD
jgi:hypothetical protein